METIFGYRKTIREIYESFISGKISFNVLITRFGDVLKADGLIFATRKKWFS
jgi:hypothetical protein